MSAGVEFEWGPNLEKVGAQRGSARISIHQCGPCAKKAKKASRNRFTLSITFMGDLVHQPEPG